MLLKSASSILMNARSVSTLVYIIRDLNSCPLLFCTTTVEEPLTTCALVTRMPLPSTRKPVPPYLTGVFSGERFGRYLKPYFEEIPFLAPYAGAVATSVIVIIVTFLSIIFGELIPKRIALINPEKIAKKAAAPMYFFAKVTHPIVWLLSKTSQGFFKLFSCSCLITCLD